MNEGLLKMKIDLDNIKDTITAEDVHRARCHTFDNGMNIPDCYKQKLSDEENAEIYRQYKEVVDKANSGTEHQVGCIVYVQ